jgi:hypothetical protein
MFEIIDRSHGNVVGVRATGRLHEADYRELLPKLERLFEEHGKLRLLFQADQGFEGWDLAAAWDDAAFGFTHAAEFERLALVGAPDWVEWCVRLTAFLLKGEVRLFPGDALEEAWAWIEGDESA